MLSFCAVLSQPVTLHTANSAWPALLAGSSGKKCLDVIVRPLPVPDVSMQAPSVRSIMLTCTVQQVDLSAWDYQIVIVLQCSTTCLLNVVRHHAQNTVRAMCCPALVLSARTMSWTSAYRHACCHLQCESVLQFQCAHFMSRSALLCCVGYPVQHSQSIQPARR